MNKNFKDEFKDPSRKYRGVTLWMLNDKLQHDECRRQLELFSDAGWGRVITRTFLGLKTRYLSDDWMAITETIVDKAKALGLKVWLQETDKNAVRYMPTGVPGMKDEYRQLLVVKKDKDEFADQTEELLITRGKYNFYKKMVLPPADWREFLAVLDLMDPDTVAAYLEKGYDPLIKFEGEFGKTVEAVWVDEPFIQKAKTDAGEFLPWTKNLPEIFEKKWGYSLLEHIESLFNDTGDYVKVRHHYWRTLTERFKNAYFKQVYDWCEENNVKFSGHLMGEDTLYSQITWSGAAMPFYEYMQLPGIDHLTHSMKWPADRPFIIPVKQCSSAAHQLNKNEILSEMYAVSSQGITFAGRKWIANWLLALGINYRCYHASFYSMRGVRKRVYPPHLSYQQPWWEDNNIISDYFARVSFALQQGEYDADILVIHPLESAQSHYKPRGVKWDTNRENPGTKKFTESLIELSNNLMKIQRSFDYGDESLLGKYGEISEKGISIGSMNYKVIILPSLETLRRTSVDLFKEFIKNGGTILAAGELPARIEGESKGEIEKLNEDIVSINNTPDGLKEELSKIVANDIEVVANKGNAENIWVHKRKVDNGLFYFLVNTSREEEIMAKIKFNNDGKLQYWNLENGVITDIAQHKKGKSLLSRLKFPACGSHLVYMNTEENTDGNESLIQEKRYETKNKIPLDNIYTVKRHDPNSLTLDFCRFCRGDENWSQVLPVIGIQEKLAVEKYSGPISLQFEFYVEKKPEAIKVVIEDAAAFNIKVNDKSVAYDGLAYYRDISFHPVDISQEIKAGKNIIELNINFTAGDEKSRKDLDKLYGTELEAIYLIGDFAVAGELMKTGNNKRKYLRFKPYFKITDEKPETEGNLIRDGYPFYNGKISLIQNIDLPEIREDEKAYLELEGLETVLARIYINDEETGVIAWPPHQIEITDICDGGTYKLEIELCNSLRNLLGPHHRQSGEEEEVWDRSFSGKSVDGKNWLQKREQGTCTFWTDNYHFVPFGIEGCNIIIKKSID